MKVMENHIGAATLLPGFKVKYDKLLRLIITLYSKPQSADEEIVVGRA